MTASAPSRRGLTAEDEAELRRGMPLVPPVVFPGPVSWPTVFGREMPLEVELGFGRPHFLLERAAEVPDRGVVGIEWKGRWPRLAATRAERMGLTNVCPVHGNAWLLLGALFYEGSLDGAFLNFPDPWWKARHRKRRIINDAFTNILVSRLKPGGTLFIQTDVASLLEHMLEHLEAHPELRNVEGAGRLARRKPTAARSHRERKCVEQGIPVFRAQLERSAPHR